jgi:hypothetical protein
MAVAGLPRGRGISRRCSGACRVVVGGAVAMGRHVLGLRLSQGLDHALRARWIGGFVNWLKDDATFGLFTFQDLTRAIEWVIGPTLCPASEGCSREVSGHPDARDILGRLDLGQSLCWALGRWRGWPCWSPSPDFGFIAVFGQWDSAMVTLASILIAFAAGGGGGADAGNLAFRHPVFEPGSAAAARPDADGAGLCLSGADPDPVRFFSRPRRSSRP